MTLYYDTLWALVHDTLWALVYDTLWALVYDTHHRSGLGSGAQGSLPGSLLC